MTIHAPAYKLELYNPRSEQTDPANETELLTPRSGAAHTDVFVVWTLPTGTTEKGYLQPPRGRKSSLNLSTRTSDTGSLTAEILDKRLGAANSTRWFTQFFASTNGQSRLHNILAKWYESTDGGCTWHAFFTGRVKDVKRTSRQTWEITCRDMVEDWKRPIFVGRPASSVTITSAPTPTQYAQLTPLQPHHNLHTYHNISGRGEIPGAIVAPTANVPRRIVATAGAPKDRWRIVAKTLMERASNIASVSYATLQFTSMQFRAGSVKIRLTNPSTLASGVFNLRQIRCQNDKYHAVAYQYDFDEVPAAEEGYSTLAAIGSGGTAITYVLFAGGALGGQSAILINDVHPVQLLADLCDGKFGPLAPDGTPQYTIRRDTGAAVWSDMIADGSWGTVSFIVDKQETFSEWVPPNLCVPHGLAITVDADGNVVPVDMRPQSFASLPTITDDDLATGDNVFEGQSQSLSDALTVVDVTYFADILETDLVPSRDQADYPDVRPGLINPVKQEIRVVSSAADVVDLGFRPKKITANGLRYSPDYVSAGAVANARIAETKADALATTWLAEYARGSRPITLKCRRTAVPAATYQGDVRFLDCTGLFDHTTLTYGGVLVARCIERVEDGAVINLTFQAAGVSTIAAVPTLGTPTFTGADQFGATFSVPVTVNAAGDPVEIQVAVTDQTVTSPPADGDPLWTPAGVVTYSGTFYYGPYPRGMRLWIRGRSNPTLAPGGSYTQPSAWVWATGTSTTSYVDTSGLTAPSVAVDQITGTTARVYWTGGDDGQMVRVFARGGVTGGNWLTSEIVAEFPAPPREWVLGNLINLHDYVVGVALLDALGAQGPVGEATFTTTGFTSTAPRPAGIDFVIPSSIQLKVFSSDSTYDIEVERAPALLIGGPDTGNTVSFIIPRTGDYYDPLTPDLSSWWYRARHVLYSAGIQPGPYTDWKECIARPTSPPSSGGTDIDPPLGSVNPNIPISTPSPVMPTAAIAQAASGGTGTLTVTVTDPQSRVTAVEFQTYDGSTTSAWTADPSAPYQATVSYLSTVVSIIRYRLIGYDSNGNSGQTLVAGEAYFGGTIVNHASRHENGGADEINVGGLSGVLADPQNAGWLDGVPVVAPAPNAGDVLEFDGSGWVPQPPGGGGRAVGCTFDAAGGTLDLLGQTKLRVAVPAGGTIARVQVDAIGAGSATIGVKRGSSGGSLADITGGNDVTTSGTQYIDTTLTGWSLTHTAYAVYEFELKTVSGFTQVTITLHYA